MCACKRPADGINADYLIFIWIVGRIHVVIGADKIIVPERPPQAGAVADSIAAGFANLIILPPNPLCENPEPGNFKVFVFDWIYHAAYC
jgi:hypothetical protein